MAETESRVKKSILNAKVNLIFYFIILVLSFFSRKIFLDSLGADFVGFTGTLQNLLGFLNLAELGIATAIGYVLYKPLFDHDQQKINEIVSVLGYLYRWIGIIILGAGVILSAFLPLIFPETGFDIALIYFAYYSFLASTLIGYFINYRQNLLGADQKNYVVVGYYQTANIIKLLVQMVSAYYTGSYYLWVAIELAFGIGYSFVLNWKIDQTYPWLKTELKDGHSLLKKYPEIYTYTKQLFVHQINQFAQFQTTPFFIYLFESLKIVAFYGNYSLIVDKLTQLMNTVLGSTAAGIGNLIAEGNQKKIEHIFWELSGIRYWSAGIIVFSLFMLIDQFIILWLGYEYLLPRIILYLLLIKIYIQVITGCVSQFLYGYGLFSDVWSSIAQSIIFVVVAIVGGRYFGLAGIIFAAFISITVIMGIWKPYFLYTKGFKMPVWDYWKSFCKYNVINACSMILTYAIVILLREFLKMDSFISFVVSAGCITIIYIAISFTLFYFFTNSTKRLIARVRL